MSRRLTYLNEGHQCKVDHRAHLATTFAPQYYANQAHYVALLMQHEVAAHDLLDGQLCISSPFHEEYWDVQLEEMAIERHDKQRHHFQGGYMYDQVDYFTDETYGNEGTAKSAGELTTEAVEITPAECHITDEVYYQEATSTFMMNGRIAHAAPTKTACTHFYDLQEPSATGTEVRRDYSASFEDHIMVQSDVNTSDYFPAENCTHRTPNGADHYDPPFLSCKLLDERQQETDVGTHIETQDRPGEEAEHEFEEPMLIIEEWEHLRTLLDDRRQEAATELNLVMYGLFQDSIGTRYATAQSTIEAIRHSVMQAWQDYLRPGTFAYLHMVRPQSAPDGSEMKLLVEFSNRFFNLPAGDIPTVRRVTWEGVWSAAEPVAAYHTQGISIPQLLLQSGLREWCGPDLRTTCNLHIEGRITPPLSRILIQPGSLLEVYIHFNAIEETEEEHTALFQTRARASSPNPHVVDLCCGAEEYVRATSLQPKISRSRKPQPRTHAENDRTASSSAHPTGQTANRGSSQSSSGNSDEYSDSRTSHHDEDSSGSDFDPGSYGWDDELPHGLVKVACFKRGPTTDPILSIVSMRNEDDLHDHLATLYRIPAQFIKGIVFVAPEPTFATENGAWPIIVEQTQDRHDVTTQKLVVIQAEFYYSQANAADVATQWRVVILPHLATRSEVIAATDALNYCEALADGRCLVWHRSELWPQQGPAHIISDGDLIRVAIPPIDEDMCESTWIRVQDAHDAGRLVGFPMGSSDEEQRELTPRSSLTGLRSSSVSDASDLGSDMQDQFPPSSPQQQAHGICCSSLGSPADFTQHPNADSANPQSFFVDDRLQQLLRHLTHRRRVQAVELVMYGLYQEDVGSFRDQLHVFTTASIDRSANLHWPIFAHLHRNYFIVDPQPPEATATSIHVLVEFYDAENTPHPAHIPLLESLHLWLADGDTDVVRQAVYYDRFSKQEQLFRGLGDWCEDRSKYRCDAWRRTRAIPAGGSVELHHGDLLTLRVACCHPTWKSPVYRTFPNADAFYGMILDATATQSIGAAVWHLLWQDGSSEHTSSWETQGSPVAAINLSVLWYGEGGGILHFVEHYYKATGRIALLFSPRSSQGTPCLCWNQVTYGSDETEETFYLCTHPPVLTTDLLDQAGLTLRASIHGATVEMQIDGNGWHDDEPYPGACLHVTVDIPSLGHLVENLLDTSLDTARDSDLSTTTSLLHKAYATRSLTHSTALPWNGTIY